MEVKINKTIESFFEKLNELNLFLVESEGNLILKGRKGKLTKEEILLIKQDASIVNFIKDNKESLIEYLNNQSHQAIRSEKGKITAIYELSPLQGGMLFHGLYDGHSKAYVEQFNVDFPEGVDPEILKKSWDFLIEKHTILRSSFIHDRLNIPVQCVHESIRMPFELIDFSELPKEEQAYKIETLVATDYQRGFDFTVPPMMRISLIKTSANNYKMLWTFHHIILDGWSIPILLEELLNSYEALAKGETPQLGEVDQFEDYIKYINARDKYEEEQFWKNYMQDFSTASILPFGGNTLNRNKGEGTQERNLFFDADFTAQLKKCAKAKHLTVNTLVQGVWSFLLSQYTGNIDTVFGVTVSGRPSDLENAEDRVGIFINTMPLRSKLTNSLKVIDWLTEIQEEHTASREYQYTSLSKIQNWAGIQGDFFDSIIVFENYPMEEVLGQKRALTIGEVEIKEMTNYVLTLTVDLGERLHINFGYNDLLLKDEYVVMIQDHFEQVLRGLLILLEGTEEEAFVGKIDMLSEREKAMLLGAQATESGLWFNEGEKDLGNVEPINVRFERIAEVYKDSVALVHGDESTDYETLNTQANQIARSLAELGIQQGDFVGIYLERNAFLVSGILGILKLGAVYVPLDTNNPKDRIEKMIAGSQLKALVSRSGLVESLELTDPIGLILSDVCPTEQRSPLEAAGMRLQDVEAVKAQKDENLDNKNEMRSWAYMLYTSGSTGEPKGAITRHDGAMNHLLAEYEALELADGFRFLQSAGIGSDISIWQILAPLLKGGAVVIIDKMELLDYDKVFDILKKDRISIVEFVPSYIWSMTEYMKERPGKITLPDLRWIMMVGEAVPIKLANDWKRMLPEVRVLNGYGPCEASDDITQYEVLDFIDEMSTPRVPIGRPLSNLNMFVLDPNGELCPIGVAGELCVSGIGVGAGYWNMPEKTAASFVSNPFEGTLGDTMYKTGDLGRWLPDGNLEFLGRIDRQVKVKGHRIELGEIENVLRKEDHIKAAHVMVREDDKKRKSLLAFIVKNKTEVKQIIEADQSEKLAPLDDKEAAKRWQAHQDLQGEKVDYPTDKTILDLFTEQAKAQPKATALLFDERTYTYQELEEASNQLAHFLLAKGAEKGRMLPVCIENSIEMIVGLLGIMKAGLVAVPIDADSPVERLSFVLKDVEASLILAHSSTYALFASQAELEVFCIDEVQKEFKEMPKTPVAINLMPDQVIDVLYTSGTTGRPKGVLSCHNGLVNFLLWMRDDLAVDEKDVFLQKTIPTFDVFKMELYLPLITGGQLVLTKPNGHKDPNYVQEMIEKHQVTIVHFMPFMLVLFLEKVKAKDYKSLRHIVCSGEALLPKVVKKCRDSFKHARIHNYYGPTEASIHAVACEVTDIDLDKKLVPIGRPIANLEAYVVNANLELQEVGAVGELLIGGMALAEGYLNRPELTAEKFITHPFNQESNARLYRTGDLVRWLPDGQLQYIGRKDNQVKIKGVRIELEEVDAAINEYKGISQGLVVVKENASNTKSLEAYVVPQNGTWKEADFLDFLKDQVIEEMIPSKVILMEALPLLPNGKINRKALANSNVSKKIIHALQNLCQSELPAHMHPNQYCLVDEIPLNLSDKVDEKALMALFVEDHVTELSPSDNYLAPRNETEAALAEIWQKLLNVKKVGIYDNFFELGGDSIITIQVVSRAKREGLQLKPRDIFELQNIAALAQILEEKTEVIHAEQGFLKGEVALLPIQQWHFENGYNSEVYENQAFLLEIEKGLRPTHLEQSVKALVSHHDALRLRYEEKDGQWTQYYGDAEGQFHFADLSQTKEDLETALSALCQKHQESLDLTNGEMVRFVYVQMPASEVRNRLFVVADHLVVDGVSWRILLDHLNLCLEALTKGEKIDLGLKTSSFREWVNALTTYAESEAIEAELAFWESMMKNQKALLTDKQPTEKSLEKDIKTHEVQLDTKTSTALIQEANKAYHTEINDLLLGALAQTIAQWSEREKVIIGLEGHGREDLFDQLDLSNTVGWFTNLYPVAFQLEENLNQGQLIKAAKQSLRAIPRKGLGYGLLRYLHPSEATRSRLAGGELEIVFNYLGQLDNMFSGNEWFRNADEPIGESVGDQNQVSHKFEINAALSNGQLTVYWNYSEKEYQEKTIAHLSEQFLNNLREMVAHCLAQKTPERTAADYGLPAKVSYQELDAFLEVETDGIRRRDNLDSLYLLSPVQSGMLFHHLYDDSSSAYTEQFCVDFPEGIDLKAFELAWNYVLKNHTILRSCFFFNELSVPVQCVFDQVKLPFQVLDFSQYTGQELEQKIEAFMEADQQAGFDFNVAPLMRICLLKISAQTYKMIWTSHHILLDGWSSPILMGELLEAYGAYVQGGVPSSRPVDRFEDFIRYIDARDKYKEKAFWVNYIQGFENPSLLPFVNNILDRNKGVGTPKEVILTFEEAYTQKIKKFAQNHHLTINTLVQGIWAFLLSKYTGNTDVIYGVTVSGRPSDLKQTEERVGLYINTLPLRAQLASDTSIEQWLIDLQKNHMLTREYQYTALNQIQNWSGLSGDLFDSLLVFENYPIDEVLAQDWHLAVDNVETKVQTNYLLSLIVGLEETLKVNFSYNSALFDEHFVKLIKGHFDQVLRQIIEGQNLRLTDLNIIQNSEKHELLQLFNNTNATYAENLNLLNRFDTQVKANADKTAVVFGEDRLSYRELDQRSNQLAHHLIKKGLTTGNLVVVCMDRSVELIVALLAILKSGGAYVPVDPEYPRERVNYILEDTNTQFIISTRQYLELVQKEAASIVLMDEHWPAIAKESVNKILLDLSEDALAYIIYTSGSTGRPKGVMISHKNLNAFLNWSHDEFADSSFDVVFAGTSICFDLSVYEMFYTLSAGKKLRVIKSGLEIAEYLDQEENILINTVPSVMRALLNEKVDLSRVNVINMAGEPIPLVVQQGIDVERIEVRNLYGPSEDTTYSTMYRLEKDKPLLIGRPISNTKAYILDDELQLLPQGVVGELCLSGDGIARGYWNRPQLTTEKFINNPYGNTAHPVMYKTGDLARWLPDGQIEFLGRKDSQVKVRGYRIELGEIETVLQKSPSVNQSIVLAKEDPNGNKRLVAYIVPGDDFDQDNIRQYMRQQMPEYMVPAILVELEELPLTPNGKVDRKRLPDPEGAFLQTQEYVAPSSELEKQVVQIWEDLLNRNNIGLHDNFFELGGDSIITIQVVSRIKRLGYHLSPRDLFLHATVADLARFIEQNQDDQVIDAEQGILSGPAELTPIQQWFLEEEFSEMSFFNQALLLEVKKEVKVEDLNTILQTLLQHHDALRFNYQKEGDQWIQTYGTEQGQLEIEDFSQLPQDQLSDAITNTCAKHQQDLDLEKGKLVKALFIQTPETTISNRLLLAIHHLAIDGISWRILLEQLEEGLTALANGKSIDWGSKGTSFRDWGSALKAKAQSPATEGEQAYWKSAIQGVQTLPVDKPEGASKPSVLKDVAMHTEVLDEELTRKLLQEVSQAYQTEINDILLGALAQTLATWAKQEKILIGLEGHGREEVAPQIDITNTVGWFTSLYPVALQVDQQMKTSDLIKSVKEQMRHLPAKGIGFGLLKYLHPSEAIRKAMAAAKWEVIFNYLGQLDNVLESGKWIKEASEPIGESVSDFYPFAPKFLINSSISKGQLSISWNYSTLQYEEGTIQKLAAAYVAQLQILIEHCAEQKTVALTPSDFGLPAQVSYQELDRFLYAKDGQQTRKDNVAEIYRLSPMQEGMLFHALYDKSTTVYVEQFKVDLSEDLNIEALRFAWKHILKQHSILRNAFFSEAFSIPVQCTFKELPLPFIQLDFSDMDQAAQKEAIAKFLLDDQLQGFDLSQPPLMRLTLIQLAEGYYKMVWTSHHLLLDGWSIPILIGDLLTAYDAYVDQRQLPTQSEDNYADYIRYIESRDRFEEEAFWRQYMEGFDHTTLLPFVDHKTDRNKGRNEQMISDLNFDEAFSNVVKNYSQKHHLTTNTIVQGVWAILLSHYTQRTDVTFGATVSGRSVDMEDSESRVGLYINTLPLRVKLEEDRQVTEWLLDLQKGHTSAREFQYSSLKQIQNWTGLLGDFFDSIMLFENYPEGDAMDDQRTLKVGEVEVEEQNNLLLTISAELTDRLNLRFNYNGAVLSTQNIERIKGHFDNVLRQIIEEDKNQLSEIDILTETEKTELLLDFNDTERAYPHDKTLMEIFEAQVESTPDAVALVFQDKKFTYRELNHKANALAHHLQSNHALASNDLVGIMLERSEWCVISILAILKTGAAYVPVDTKYPIERQVSIINDTDIKAIIVEFDDYLSLSATDINQNIEILPIDVLVEAGSNSEALENVCNEADAQSLAYIMYTSGSTGKPKGVAIKHQSILRLVFNESLGFLDEQSIIYQYAPLAFDASTFELWGALLKGGQIVVPEPELKTLESIAADIQTKGVNTLWLTAGLFHLAVDDYIELFSGIRFMLAGGDSIRSGSIQKLLEHHPELVFINGYGPTESTTFATTHRMESVEEISHSANIIGRPLMNTKAYILNPDSGQLVPRGCFGELCLAGPGLSPGYRGQEALTQQKFMANPYDKEEYSRLYRTGDWARWLDDGTIEFAGRRDHQVKIRGYRIELEEIEKVMHQSDLVKQCAVIVHEDDKSVKRLVAYIVPEEAYEKNTLLTELNDQLPDYMVPALMIELEQMPLNFNGKIDKSALPEFETTALLSTDYAAPTNEVEERLAEIWTGLLSVDRVGIYDNFFELGGDSIITIQVVSRAKQIGYALSPKDMFVHQTVAALAKLILESETTQVIAEQDSLGGAAALLPIQQWFFEDEFSNFSHFNQEALLEVDKLLSEEHLQQAIAALVEHHDALRFKYQQVEGQWTQSYGKAKGQLLIEDLTNTSSEDLANAITKLCQKYQNSLDIEAGKMLQAVLIKTPESEAANRFFIVIHHLVVDGVSWRILLDHMEMALQSLAQGKAIDLGRKSSSYRAWAEALIELAQSERFEEQGNYWEKTTQSYQALPIDKKGNEDLALTEDDLQALTVTLDEATTKALLQESNRAYHTEINDLLLSALTKTLCQWSGQDKLLVGMEGHGREDIVENIDHSNSIGWYTSLYPIALSFEVGDDAEKQLLPSIKEQLRLVPDKGIGFGLLRYLHPDQNLREKLSAAKWDVVFNYLGQLDNVIDEAAWFKDASEDTGRNTSEDCPFRNKLLINSAVSKGQLSLTWAYAEQHYDAETIQELAQNYLANLTQIVEHCKNLEESEKTPSDFGLAPAVNYRELQQFMEKEVDGEPLKNQITSLYKLSPVQEGMLFHGLFDEASKAYAVQFVADFPKGVAVDHFESAWKNVLKNHTVLRTGFVHDELSIPVQYVYKEVDLSVEVVDYSAYTGKELEEKVEQYLEEDHQKGFDFTRPPLMRVALIKLDDTAYRMVWTHHHLLFDGWSLPILIEEFMDTYSALQKGQSLEVKSEDVYEEHIKHINSRNRFAEKRFWKGYMDGLENPSLLPFISDTVDRNKGTGEEGNLFLEFDQNDTQSIKAATQKHRLTVNTLIQGVWSYLLSKYTANQDVVFGVTVSGRPTDLAGAEDKIGLFINMLPLRTEIVDSDKVINWLSQIQDSHTTAREFQHTGLTEIQRWNGVIGDFFDSILVFENYPIDESLGEDSLLQVDDSYMKDRNNYLLDITVELFAELSIKFIYDKDLLAPPFVEMIRRHFKVILDQMVKVLAENDYDSSLVDLDMVATEERAILLGQKASPSGHWFNRGEQDLGNTDPINVRFEKVAEEHPNAVALLHGTEEWTFEQINALSNQIARSLIAAEITPGQFVGVYLERGVFMVCSLLGILKAGATYVPLDTNNPDDRIEKMIESSQLSAIVSTADLFNDLEIDLAMGLLLPALCSVEQRSELEARGMKVFDRKDIEAQSSSNVANQNDLRSWAYMLYTSGSTGEPKGAITRHDGAMNHLLAEYKAMELKDGFRFLQSAGIGSDISVWQILAPLLKGGAVVMIDKMDLLDYEKVIQLLNSNQVEVVEFVPSYIWALTEYLQSTETTQALPHLQWIMMVGEAVPIKLVNEWRRLFPHIRILNGYGPCEASDDIAQFEVTEILDEAIYPRVPIGEPLMNMNIFILSPKGQLCGIGVAGELGVSGVGVGAGYWGMPEKTEEKFVANPFPGTLGDTLYKTGDLARWLPDGNLDFLGRIDRQIKVRGHRIELGEIESFIRQSPKVSNAYIKPYSRENSIDTLIAFLVVEGMTNINDPAHESTRQAIRQEMQVDCQNALPPYMQPTHYCFIDKIPLNLSDKVDEKKLMAWYADQAEDILHDLSNYVAPNNETETALAVIWSKLLGHEKVSVLDDFFEVGGDSLLAMRVVSHIRKDLLLNVRIRVLFEHTTIRELAKYLRVMAVNETSIKENTEDFEVFDI